MSNSAVSMSDSSLKGTCFVCGGTITPFTWRVKLQPKEHSCIEAHEGCMVRAVENRWANKRENP